MLVLSFVVYLFCSPSHCERSAGGLGAKWSSCLFWHWRVVAAGWNCTQVHPLPSCARQFKFVSCVPTFGFYKMFVFLCVEAMCQQEEAQFVYSVFNKERGTTNAKWQHWLFALQANCPQHGRENVFGKMEGRMSMFHLSFWRVVTVCEWVVHKRPLCCRQDLLLRQPLEAVG